MERTEAMSLTEKKPGFEGPIKDIIGDEWITLRLQEMGIIKGSQVVFRGTAPFGDPVIIEVHGLALALRKSEAACIRV